MNELFNEDGLIQSSDYASVMNDHVIPELNRIQEVRNVRGKDHFPLYCSVFRAENPRGTVLVMHGFTENAYKFSELVRSLVRNQFCVVAYDQRGHGRSGRAEGLSHPSVTHVDRFEDYVEDLEIICGTVLSGLPKPWTVFAHSMGGAVTVLYLERHHSTFSAAALCAPMIAPNTGVPVALAAALCRTACLLGKEKKHPFFMKPFSGSEDFETSSASDPIRFEWYNQVKASREDFWNSIPTYRWTVESIGVTRKILFAGAPESITCPILLSSAENDGSVMPEAQKQFIERVPKGKRILVKGSRHEIFRSPNPVLFPWWHEILLFLKEAKDE